MAETTKTTIKPMKNQHFTNIYLSGNQIEKTPKNIKIDPQIYPKTIKSSIQKSIKK